MSRSCGALQKLTGPAGNVTAWDWNIIGQNLSKTYADGRKFTHTIAYLNGAQGRPSGYTLPGGGESSTYDAVNRIATSTSVMGTTTRTYQGTSSRVLSAISPSGPRTLMTYGTATEDFRLKEISNQTLAGAVISRHNYTFTKDSQIATWQRTYGLGTSPPDAETYDFGYDGADRLTSGILKKAASGEVLADHQFLYDPADNRVSIRERSSLKSGTFNNANQLTAEAGGGKVRITGSINKPGASVSVAGQAAAVHPQGGFAVEVQAAPGANRFPLVVTEADGTVTNKYVDLLVENSVPVIHRYDANGNLESVAPQAAPTSPTRTYQWDAANRLVGITRILSPTVSRKTEFLYNGMGARVGKKELLNGAVESDIRYFYGGTGVLQERSADGGTVTKTYTSRGELDYSTSPATPRYYTRDHLGSVREVLAEDGTLVAHYDYKPYGERVLVSGTYQAAKGYTGHDYHADSGLVLTLCRAYDPGTGRWLSPDPIAEAGGLNLYGYVLGDPVNGWDPLGLDRSITVNVVNGPLEGFGTKYVWMEQVVSGDLNRASLTIHEKATKAGQFQNITIFAHGSSGMIHVKEKGDPVSIDALVVKRILKNKMEAGDLGRFKLLANIQRMEIACLV